MHASAEVLARLAPKIVSLTSQASGHGDLKPLDLAAALAGLEAGPWALAQVAWIDDRSSWRELVAEVKTRLRVSAAWEGVIALAVAEYCWPPSCGECFGRGEIKKKQYYGGCPACNGSGYGRVPLGSLADACGVSREEWRRVWARRYERVFRLCLGWGSEVLSHLNRRLSSEG
ncbi:MAG: hypothetical protein ACREMG_03475 [Gemmatimonadales bacterium]